MHLAASNDKGAQLAHSWHCRTIILTKGFGGFLTCADYIMAQGNELQQGRDVGFLHHFEILVGGVALKPTHSLGGVENGDALPQQQLDYLVLAERLVRDINQAGSIIVKDKPEDFPHHIGAVGIEEVHAPARPRWGEAAQHQEPCLRGQERLQRMPLCFNGTQVRHYKNRTDKETFYCSFNSIILCIDSTPFVSPLLSR